MSSREANIERLNDAITSLNEDAEGMHGLIARSKDELESATTACNRAADNAAQIIDALKPLTKLLDTQHSDSTAMLEEARKASEEQRIASSEQVEALKGAVTVTLEYVGTSTDKARSELKRSVDDSMAELSKAQDEAFDDFEAKTLKELERTRDELQTDMLSFKNATSARLDALEAEVSKAQGAIRELEGRVAESTDAASKKLLLPTYVAIALGVINLACLVMLLMR